MFRLLGLVVSIGLADSMNPSTIGPALYLAAGRGARRELVKFTAGVFAVYTLGGVLIALGPGEALLALVPHPSATTRYVLELIAGTVMLSAATVLWLTRRKLAQKRLPTPEPKGRSSALLGIGITVVELPSAFPYFAALAAIVGSGQGLGQQLILVVIYNACFVLPLLVIILTVAVAGERATRVMQRAWELLQRHWPALLAVLALLAGAFVALLGATGLASSAHGPAGAISRRLRHILGH